MIGLDTNVIVRYVTQDDPRQAAAATRVFERERSEDEPGFVSLITLCETVWVLADCYSADKAGVRAVVEGLLTSRQLMVEEAESVWKALRAWTSASADFSDVLVGQVALAHGCGKVLTFDKAAAKLPGFALLA